MYSFEEALQASINYFNGNKLAAEVFLGKYALRDNENNLLEKTPEDMHRRISKELARIEKSKFKTPLTEDEIFSYLDQFKQIIPQGSPMFGIGNYNQNVSIGNCFVLESPADSYGAIHQTDEQLTQISKRRGGVGLDLSHLRPAGSPTTNSSRISTGIVPFMERYSNSIREVGQGNRRGALMLTLSVHHPEVLNFCKVKNDRTKVTGANISVRLSNEFMEAVKNDTDYEQRWPIDKPQISQMVPARKVWKAIIKNAHLMAEPGIMFWDNIIKESPADCYPNFNTVCSNPCSPSSCPVITYDGLSTFGKLKEGDKIWSETGWTTVLRKWSTGIKKVYKYKTTAGFFLGTENHRVIQNGTKIEVKDAEGIDIIRGPYTTNLVIDPQIVMDGLVLGDGTIHKASNNLVYLCIGKDDQDYFTSEIQSLIGKHRPGLAESAYEISTNITYDELPHTYNRKVPDRYKFTNPSTICSFLRGLYSANGSVVDNRINLKAASFQIIEDVQLMLSSIGIKSYYTTNKPSNVKFNNGEYLCKQSYDLSITVDREKFVNLIGFIQHYKNDKIIIKNNKDKKTTYDIKDIEFVGEEEVFDITVDNEPHTYWSGCCNVSNCGELPLCELDSCRLLVTNLFSCVDNPYTKKAKLNLERLTHLAKISQRFMDDIIDLELEHIDRIISKIKKDPEDKQIKARELKLWQDIRLKCEKGRRTGTGETALGDTLAALGIKYGSKKSLEVTELIYKTIKLGAYESSIEMAEELGPFPVWDYNSEKDNPFLLRIKDERPDLYERMKKSGRRNIALLTTAPTGSVSLLAKLINRFGTSSGIEPVFQVEHIRRRKINPGDTAKVDFVDQNGDKWTEYPVYHSGYEEWKEFGEGENPYEGACAEELDWQFRVKLQGAAQKHVDHSISSTINLPESVTEEEVATIYETAWMEGLKGVTVYRKNCRTGVLVDKKEYTTIKKTDAPKRPKTIPCDVHHINVSGKKYMVFVGMINEPYEIMAYEGSYEGAKQGTITKIKRGTYKADLGSVVIDSITDRCTPEEEAITRLVSTSLRHGADIQFVVHQLEKTGGSMTSFAKCLARSLKKYIKDGSHVSGEECPNCSSKLTRQEGCIKCVSCEFSKCG